MKTTKKVISEKTPIFSATKPKAGKRRFTFEVDVTENMKELNFICQCKARVKSKKFKYLIEVIEIPVRYVEEKDL